MPVVQSFEGPGVHWIRFYHKEDKTRLVKIFAGAEQPASGDIFIGELNVRELSPHNLSQLLYVYSDYFVLTGDTVLQMACPKKDNSLRKKASRLLKRIQEVHPAISLPSGNSRTGRLAMPLTASQKAILRWVNMLCCPKPLLIVDEPFEHFNREDRPYWIKKLQQLGKTSNILVLSAHKPPARLHPDTYDEWPTPRSSQATNSGGAA